MKFSTARSSGKKADRIPSNSISHRRAGGFISALLRYSLNRKKHGHSKNKDSGSLATYTSITNNELKAIQIQLAILSDGDGDRSVICYFNIQ